MNDNYQQMTALDVNDEDDSDRDGVAEHCNCWTMELLQNQDTPDDPQIASAAIVEIVLDTWNH